MISEIKTIEELRKKKDRIVRARDFIFNRAAIEQKLVDILVFPSIASKKDSLKYLDSGMNSIALKIAARNKVSIGIDINALRSFGRKELGEEVARLSQTIATCRKCMVKLAYTGGRNKLNSIALLRSLGASTDQAARAISF